MLLINKGKFMLVGVESIRVLIVSLATLKENNTVKIVNMIETTGSNIDHCGLE
jgi:hypothetical protein